MGYFELIVITVAAILSAGISASFGGIAMAITFGLIALLIAVATLTKYLDRND